MTYEKIKKSIDAALQRITIKSASDTPTGVYRVMLHMDPGANSWNRAAIELSEENAKIPSRRRRIMCYPVLTVRDAPDGKRMSTNEWNDLALDLRDRHREDASEEALSNDATQPTR